jgi:hypothetical protein
MTALHFASIALIATIHLNGRSQPSAPDEATEKVAFSDVVVADSLAMDLLYQNAVKWMASLKNCDEKFELKLKDSIDGKLYGQSTFFVYSQSGILKKISGTITYRLSIEVKDRKYRYHFSDYVFHYYKQDRNYNMVPTGKTKSLEELNAAGWQKLWTSHRSFNRSKMLENIKQLELKMAEDPKKTQKLIARKVEW